MPLIAGTLLGAYEILSPLGAGGMGEVYRARDTRLDRDVAIKVLPGDFLEGEERRARFEREAKMLAALNHPGIAAIYSFEEIPGAPEVPARHVLVMELIEGESLDALIPPGGLPLPQFFEITVPLAEALSAAHERGIVHRDLKPGNVMVTREGRVKVLDFGLAKLESPDPDPSLTSTPTESRANLTGEGQVYGTVAYMSPEQARAGKVDARSDVFSLGVVLYQMLTGERPFTGSTAVDMISSILRDKPPSVTELRADLPPHLARVLRRCLEKAPRDRYQTSRDVYNELRELRAETSSASSAPSPRAAARSMSADSESGRALRQDSGRTPAQAFWIAVLPFTHSGADQELESFAEGLAEDINAGLARFPYLSVISRKATLRLKAQPSDARVGQQLGARYVVEGGIRRGASALRVNVQLVDTQTGAHLWAETYNRDLKGSDIFAMHDDVAGRVVATVADSYGVFVRSMTAMIQQKTDEALAPSEWLFQYFAYRQQLSPPAHTAMKDRLERAVKRDAGQADLWACLAQVYTDEYAFGFRTDATSLDRALAAARRAVELDRANQLGMVSLAQAYFFRQDLAAFRPTAEQAMALNRLNTDALGILGLLIVHTGEFQRGAAIVRRAMELNPNHAGWFHFGPIWEHFQRAEYDRALEHAMQVNMPSLFWQPLVIAAISGQLDRRAEAAAAVRDLLALDPGFAAHARRDIEVWHFASGLLEPVLEGLHKGGLAVPETSSSPPIPISSSPSQAGGGARPSSGAVRAEEGFWVAVLPFKYSGGNADLAALAEGLSEDIVTGLSRFSYLRVVARGSTVIEARYLMEGSLRQAGAKLRLAVQLVDAVSGAHLWAENYERTFSTEAVFELQDDLVPRIVSTVADSHGVLLHSMSEALRSKSPDQLSPYEAVLRSFGYFERVSAEELAAARSALELAVRKAPGYADAWAMLALLCAQEYGQGYSLLADSLAVGSIAARRAVEAGPSNHLAHSSLAQVLFLQKELQAFRNAAARAAALNPMDGATVALMGILLAYAGDWEHGCAVAEGAMRLNPNFPGWYRLASIVNAYRTRDYRAAIDAALKIQMPGYFWTPVFCAAAYGQLGEREAGRKAVGELLAIRPGFGSAAREEFGKWHEPELVEHYIDGLRKAGLDVPVVAALAPAPGPGTADGSNAVSIAVLPFSDMSAAKDQDYLCEGMAEEIMNALVGTGGIRVAARTSTFRAARQGEDLAAIARALNVGHVLEGSVRTSGSQLRVTAQLTDVATGFQVWSERFDRDAADVFAVQDEIAAGVVEAVRSRLGAGGPVVPARAQVRNFEAYQHYLKGRHLRYTKNDHGAALLSFEKAVALDPSHGPSWVSLADIHVLAAAYGMRPSGEAYAQARNALATAARLQGETADARYVEGMIAFSERRWADADRAMARAIQIEPGNVQAHCWSGVLLSIRGRVEDAIEALEHSRELDPLAPYPYAMTGFCLLNLRRPAEAEQFAEQALAFDEDNNLAIWVGGAADVARGEFDQAISRLEHAVARARGNPFIEGTLGWALAAGGRTDEARGVLDDLRGRAVPEATILPEAWLLASLGETEPAFDVLRRACDENLLLVPFIGLPGYDPLRGDPRFTALLKKMGLPK